MTFHKKSKIQRVCKNRVTLKALANVSPGFALKPWVQKCPVRFFVTLKGLRGFAVTDAKAQLLQSCAFEKLDACSQGCQSATLGWNWRTLSALFIADKSSQERAIDSTFCAKPLQIVADQDRLVCTSLRLRMRVQDFFDSASASLIF